MSWMLALSAGAVALAGAWAWMSAVSAERRRSRLDTAFTRARVHRLVSNGIRPGV